MKYTSTQYAQAFVALAQEIVSDKEERELIRNFASLIDRNGDSSHRDEIVQKTDRMLRRQYDKRTVLLETARPVKDLHKKLHGFIKRTDIVEEKISPELVAGVRITVDDEQQFDGTLARKLKVLFSH